MGEYNHVAFDPREFSSQIVAVVYNPHLTGAKNNSIRVHLFQSLLLAESSYANCGLIIGGDLLNI